LYFGKTSHKLKGNSLKLPLSWQRLFQESNLCINLRFNGHTSFEFQTRNYDHSVLSFTVLSHFEFKFMYVTNKNSTSWT